MKAKASVILFSVIFIIILGSIGTYFIFKPEQEAVFPQTCSSSTTQQYTNSFTCPSSSDSCNAILELNCNQQSGSQPRAIARTDDTNFAVGWIAYDNRLGGMDSYTFDSEVYYAGNPPGTKDDIVSSGFVRNFFADRSTGKLYIYKGPATTSTYYGRCHRTESPQCQSGTEISRGRERCDYPTGYRNYVICQNGNYYRYILGSGANTNSASQSACRFPEVCSGNTNIYSCDIPYTVNNNGNTDWKVTYSGSSNGTTTRVVGLNPSQTIRFSPSTPNSGSIEGRITTVQQSQCTQDQPVQGNNRQYEECIQGANNCGVIGTTKTCPTGQIFKSSLASQGITPPCEVPYTVKVNYLNKSIIGIPYNIDIDVDDSLREDDLNVRVSIVGKSISDAALTDNDGKVDFSLDIDNLAPGFYTLKVEVTNHPSGLYNREFTFELIEPFTVQLDIDNLAPSNDRPIEAICRTESGDRLINANVEFEAIWEGNNIIPTRRIPVLGFVKAEYTINGEGPLRVRCRATYQEYTSAWTNYQTINVRTAGIRIVTEFTSGSGVCDDKFYTQKFKTLDPQGTAIDTDNLVKLKGPGLPAGGEAMQLSKEATGEYSFSYFFENAGLYTVNIDSSKEGFAPTSLNAGNGAPITINSCGIKGPGGNIIWYIVGFVVITGIIVFFIFRRKK